jgi:hypothetical protein
VTEVAAQVIATFGQNGRPASAAGGRSSSSGGGRA